MCVIEVGSLSTKVRRAQEMLDAVTQLQLYESVKERTGPLLATLCILVWFGWFGFISFYFSS